MKKTKKAIVLFSGGLDSATTLYIAKHRGYDVSCLIFDYGQRHRKEINAAKKVAGINSCSCELIKIKLPWQGSSLLDIKIDLPKKRSWQKIAKEIPSTYVPARNTIFLSYALSFAEASGAQDIFIGANSVDFSGYPDCRPEYFYVYQKLIKVGTRKGNIRIRIPLLEKTKAEIIKKGISLGVPYKLTWSCYHGGRRPCGSCDSCRLRQKGFRELGIPDPLLKE